MKQVLARGGAVFVDDVPAPVAGERDVLVRVAYSCLSAGTERTSVELSGLPLYRRALKQPHHARRALELAREQGYKRTYDRIRARVDAGLPIGYSAAGTIASVGAAVDGLAVGDRVACAGAGYANHAELVDVPVALAVPVPANVTLQAAATATLGAIALQGVRRTEPTLGEAVGVLGLGIVGQLTAQLLRTAGCRVIGADVDPSRVQIARAGGMDAGVGPGDGSFVERARTFADGYGLDAVVVTAATPSHDVIARAFQSCRRRGRVVLVGDVGLRLDRNDLYLRELDLRMATSYGPGRYDPVYEEEGLDYPLPYVRWTENRNLAEYLRLLATGAVSLRHLAAETYDVDDAPAAYAALAREAPRPLLVTLRYPEGEDPPARRVDLRRAAPVRRALQVALVGAGSFAEGTHLPNLLALRDRFQVRCVVSRTGTSAKAAAARAGAAYAATDLEEALADPEVDLVLIATRHDTHARLALRALEAGKHVFVEKPLALDRAELDLFEERFLAPQPTLLMTGFNRRFAPPLVRARELLAGRSTPLAVDYRMNAGYLPPEHWLHGPQGGGRNLGEACHVYDLFNALVGAPVASVHATAVGAAGARPTPADSFVTTVAYADGSVCTLLYTALGSRAHPKERMEVFADGRVLSLDDYRSLAVAGSRRPVWRSRTVEKGHREELVALADALRDGGAWPIPLEEQLAAMRVAFDAEDAIRGLRAETP